MRCALPFVAFLGACTATPLAAPREHPTIVSLNPCSDAILAEVADPAQILAISSYSQDPRATSMPLEQARRFRSTSGSAEEVLALAPDVVVASQFLAPATRQAFARFAVRVQTVGSPETVAQSEDQVRQLARLAGHPERGERLVARIERALSAARASGPPRTALLWQPGGIVAGPDTLAAELLRRTGFVSLSAARGLGQGAYLPLEQVLADPPQVILAAGSERMLNHPVLRRLNGVRYERLDPALLYCGGPTIVRAAHRLAETRATVSLPPVGGGQGGLISTHPPATGRGEA